MSKQQQIWFVTGASQGLGVALVRRLLAKNHRVAATTRNISRLCEAVGVANDRLLPLAVDLTDDTSIAAALEQSLGKFGSIDVLVNNAGYGLFGSIEEISAAEAKQQYEINVFGALNVMRAILPHMRERSSGHILNVSSIAGLVSFGGWGLYCSSKFAIEGLSEALAQEVAPFGIHVTLLELGYFRTSFLSSGSLSSAAAPIAAYTSVRELQRSLSEFHGQEIGDPIRGADAIIAATELPKPPLRLLLGSDALRLSQQKLEQLRNDFEQNKEVTLSTDFTSQAAD